MTFQALVLLSFEFKILSCLKNTLLRQTTSLGYAIKARHLMYSAVILKSLNDAKMLGGLITASKMLQHLFETYFLQ